MDDEAERDEQAHDSAGQTLAKRLGAVRVQLHALRVHVTKGDGCDPELVATHLEQIDREVAAIAGHVHGTYAAEDPSLVLDHLPVMMGYTDRDLRVRVVNEAVCRTYGRPREAILGRTVQEVVGPTVYARVRPGIEAALRGEAVHFDDIAPDWYGPGLDGVSEEHYVPRFGPDGAVEGIEFLSIDVTAQRRTEAALRASEAVERALARRLLLAREDERRALAHELHEGLGQALAGVALWLAGTGASNTGAEGAHRLVEELAGRARRLAIDLRPQELEAFGLLPALHGHLARFERRTGLRVDLRAGGVDRRFPAPVEIAAYRIVEEALINVARHAGVDQATVSLAADAAVLTVTVRDSGRGFDPAATAPGGGLAGMRERAELLGGTLAVDATPGAGVAVIGVLPLAGTAQAAAS
jgi:PAS domain S-box-containing protein